MFGDCCLSVCQRYIFCYADVWLRLGIQTLVCLLSTCTNIFANHNKECASVKYSCFSSYSTKIHFCYRRCSATPRHTSGICLLSTCTNIANHNLTPSPALFTIDCLSACQRYIFATQMFGGASAYKLWFVCSRFAQTFLRITTGILQTLSAKWVFSVCQRYKFGL